MMMGASAKHWLIASMIIVICIAAIVADCTDSAVEVRMREAQKLCGQAVNRRCLALALQPGALYQENRPHVLKTIANLRAALRSTHSSGTWEERQGVLVSPEKSRASDSF